jgi:3-oxoadipate enol-lactonase
MTIHRTAFVSGGALAVIDEGSGPPIVLLHAGVADSSSWDDVVPRLIAAGYRAIRYDARDFGKSFTEPVEYSAREDLWSVMDTCGIKRAMLVGNSMGGSTCIDAALERPDRVVALILAGTGLSGFDADGTPAEERAFEEIDRSFREGRYLDAVETRVRIWVDGVDQSPERVASTVREHARAMILPVASVEGPKAKRRPLAPAASDRLRELGARTVIVVGEHDTSIIHGIAAKLESELPDVRVVRLADTAHMIGMERPSELAAVVVEEGDALDPWD